MSLLNMESEILESEIWLMKGQRRKAFFLSQKKKKKKPLGRGGRAEMEKDRASGYELRSTMVRFRFVPDLFFFFLWYCATSVNLSKLNSHSETSKYRMLNTSLERLNRSVEL